MRALLFVIPLLASGGLFAFFYAGLEEGRDPMALPSVLIDRPVPEFGLPALLPDGQGLATADFGGEPMLMNVFASWCVPCKAEHPLLMRMARENGLTIHGIAYKDKGDDARGFLSDLGNPYGRVGHDEAGRAGLEWGVYGVPETFLIDRDGNIRWKHTGPLTPDVVDKTLIPLMRSLEG